VNSCDKDKIIEPRLTILPISNITYTTASSGGEIANGGGAYMTAQGVCWSTSQAPTITSSKTVQAPYVGKYVSNITGLTPGTTYYVRAYATNPLGTGYSTQLSFTTLAQAIPTLTTTAVSSITSTAATSGGNITSDGGASVTARGVCWNTSQNPTVSLTTKTTNGTGTGSFTSQVTGLTPGTTYYLKAYATNSNGTGYGNEVTFSTPGPPTVTTTAVTSITSTTASSGGNVTSDGGSTVTARGVCWSTSQNPTVSLTTKTSNGTGTGSFTSSITGLALETTYYLRAYATNSSGTGYGNQITFTTIGLPVLTTADFTFLTATTGSSGGNITSDGGGAVTARGVCWSTSQNPTVSLTTKTSDGTGTGVFTSSVTGIASGTTYYLRAYATNSAGTRYGNEISFSYVSTPPTSGLIGYYPFTGNANDATTYSNNATIFGPFLTTNRKSATNSAYSFDGVNDYMIIPTATRYNVQSFTISLWMKVDGAGAAGKTNWGLVSKNNGSTGYGDQFYIYISQSYLPGGRVGNGTSVLTDITGTTALNDSKWHNIILRLDGSLDNLDLFVDNVKVATGKFTSTLYYNTDAINLGYWAGYINYFKGCLDDIRFYSRALTAGEIFALYNE